MRPDTYCYTTCEIRYVPNNISRTCIRCPYDCLACLLNGQCLDCDGQGDARAISLSTSRCMPTLMHY